MSRTDSIAPAPAAPTEIAGSARAAGAARRRFGSLPPLRLLAFSALVALFAAIPLIFMVSYVLQTGWGATRALVFRPLIGELLMNTASLVILGAACCAALGAGLAWLVERTDLPFPALWTALLAAPLAVPAFINSYAWVTVRPELNGLKASVLVTTLSYYPLVFLPAAAALRTMDPAFEESARALGLGPMRVFLRVVLPQLRIALCGGALLVSLHLLAEYGAIEQLRYPTFATAIIAQYESTFASTAANVLAVVLVLCCAVLIAVEAAVRGPSRISRLGAGSARRAVRVHLGWRAAPCIAMLLVLLALALGVPAYSVWHWLSFGGADAWNLSELAASTWSTVRLGATAAICAVLVGFPVAWLAVRYRGVLPMLLERTTYLSSSLPGVVVGLALVTASIRYARPLYQTTALIIAGYVMLFLPRAMVNLRSAIGQSPPALEESSRALGASPIATFRRVTLPLAAPGVASAAALVFLAVATELTATLLLAPTGTHTLATQFWAAASEIDYPAAAPYALMMIMLSIPATWILVRQSYRAAPR